jgi:hypothetical protein
MKSNIFIMLLFSYGACYGQDHFIGLKSGINISNVRSDLFSTEDRISINGGITYDYSLAKKWTIGLGLFYQRNGFITDLTNVTFISDNRGDTKGARDPIDFSADYLLFPLSVGVKGTKTTSLFCKVALIPSFLIRAEAVEIVPNNKEINVSDEVTKFDLIGQLEAGVHYQTKSQLAIFSSLAYQQGFKKISNPDYYPESNILHCGFLWSIGVKYKISKNTQP